MQERREWTESFDVRREKRRHLQERCIRFCLSEKCLERDTFFSLFSLFFFSRFLQWEWFWAYFSSSKTFLKERFKSANWLYEMYHDCWKILFKRSMIHQCFTVSIWCRESLRSLLTFLIDFDSIHSLQVHFYAIELMLSITRSSESSLFKNKEFS